ncbi:BRE1 E3 ubiquitin ligase-domain-containing protein [Lipomyces arxii]|uniref:BRE1 E3 ubiquitin ligase-domain-containing protein n=1 Tax=Lipomyces arxii TaxID=56418 RepID=UPI0034CFFA75
MEDHRKRQLASVKTEPGVPPLKRQAIDLENSRELLTQDDVLLFQKEAIFRQMQVYRRERDLLQTRVTAIEQQSVYHDDHLRILELWWDQLLNEINILSGLPNTTQDLSSVPKALLEFAPEAYSTHLADKRNLILQSLNPLFSTLQTSNATTPPDAKQLQQQLGDLQAQITIFKTENERLNDERQDLSRRLTDATFKFMSAEKRLDRLKSSTLAKIERAGQASPSVKAESSDEKQDSPKLEQIDQKVIARIKEEAEAVVNKQSQELKLLQEKVVSLTDELTKSTLRLSTLSESDVGASEPYKTLKIRFDDLASRANHLEALNDIVKQESEKLSSERTEYRELVTAEYRVMADDLQSQLKRLEQDLVRIRSARDDLLQDLSVRKAKEEQKMIASKELEELAATREARIKTLELEVERLKHQLDTAPAASKPSPVTESPEELMKRIEKLEKQNQFLAAELPGLESAFNQAYAQSTRKVADIVEREEKMGRLLAEKSKAEQKYFSAMRAKEAIALENKALKVQSSKSGEIIQQLRDAEKSVSQKVIALEKQIGELETIRHTYQKQVQDTQRKLSEQTVGMDMYKNQIDKLNSELQARSAAVVSESESRRQAEAQVEKLKVQLEHKKGDVSVINATGASDNLEAYRTLAICSVCSKNWKDTVIKVCGHCFCYECAKDRLDARLRKCPACNKQFSQNDLMHIHL